MPREQDKSLTGGIEY